MEVYGVVYLLIDGTNGFEYVGQTTRTVEERFREHAKCKTTYIGRAIQKHGKKNFAIAILKECESKEELDYWERYFIESLRTISPYGYNLSEGGEGSSMSYDESRVKVSVTKRSDTPFKNLICEMNNKNLTFRGLAKLLGCSHTVLSAKMRGKQNFTKKYISKLVEIFDKPIEYLLERDDGKSYVKPPTVHRAYSPYKNLLNEIESRQMLYTNLATILGISLNSFSRKMRGKQSFTAEQVAKLVEIFDKPAEYLMARDDGLPAIMTETEKSAKRSKERRGDSPFKNLLSEMDNHNVTYGKLTEILGLKNQTSISERIRGKTRFNKKDIAKLVEIFDKPAEYLMARDEN